MVHIDESFRCNVTSGGSSESWSQHLTPWNHLSRGWHKLLRYLCCAASWTASKFQHLFPPPPFASSWVPLPGYWLLPSPFCRLAQLIKHLWRCKNDTRCPTCTWMWNHCEIYIEHTYRILTMPMCTQLRNWIWDVERGFRLVEAELQLQAGTGLFPSSPSHSNLSKLYFSHSAPPGVSERRGSVNLEASISGVSQTLGVHSGWHLEEVESLVTGTGEPWVWLW